MTPTTCGGCGEAILRGCLCECEREAERLDELARVETERVRFARTLGGWRRFPSISCSGETTR